MVEVIKKNSNFSGRFYLLDIARAVAAICVVLHHYQHFYFVAPNIYQKNFSRSQQPFFEIIEPFYQFGSIAVQFFFVLSGFIFFFKYKDVISSKNISFKNFIILRISRLYPLHLFTLFFMVFIQFYYQRLNGEYYVYQDGNTLKNFILHFFLIQEWGFNSGWGFNAASWSISVEFLLYITFFYIALTGIKNLLQSLYILLLILILYCFMHPAIGNLMIGFLCFYIGGVTYFIYLKLHELINASFKKKLFIIFFLIILDVLIFGKFFNSFFLKTQINLDFLIGDRLMLLLLFVKFPLIIINLNLIQSFFINLGKPLKLLGDVSYAIYLTHVPIEVVYSLIDKKFIDINFDDNYIFLSYLFSVIIFSFLIFNFFEKPLKDAIRKKLVY